MVKINLSNLLTREKVQQLNESAKKLGFRDIRIFSSAKPGYLGVFAIFNDKVKKEECNIRSQALLYSFTQILGCKLGIISNNFTLGTAIENTSVSLSDLFVKSNELEQVFIDNFKKNFNCSLSDHIVEQVDERDFLYQHEIQVSKEFFELAGALIKKETEERLPQKEQGKNELIEKPEKLDNQDKPESLEIAQSQQRVTSKKR